MELHRRIGLTFATFCGVMLAWAILTPENPDHLANIIIHGVLTPVFAFSVTFRAKVGGWVQVAALFFGASITALGGDFQPASAVGSVAVLLIYAYGGFRSIRISVIIPTASAQFALTFIAALLGEYDVTKALGHAICWTSLSILGVWVVWIIFQQYAKDIIEQNHDVLEASKEILKRECNDGPGK